MYRGRLSACPLPPPPHTRTHARNCTRTPLSPPSRSDLIVLRQASKRHPTQRCLTLCGCPRRPSCPFVSPTRTQRWCVLSLPGAESKRLESLMLHRTGSSCSPCLPGSPVHDRVPGTRSSGHTSILCMTRALVHTHAHTHTHTQALCHWSSCLCAHAPDTLEPTHARANAQQTHAHARIQRFPLVQPGQTKGCRAAAELRGRPSWSSCSALQSLCSHCRPHLPTPDLLGSGAAESRQSVWLLAVGNFARAGLRSLRCCRRSMATGNRTTVCSGPPAHHLLWAVSPARRRHMYKQLPRARLLPCYCS
jgi:hypothetical protein